MSLCIARCGESWHRWAIADYTPDVASIQEMWGEKDQILAAIEAKTGLAYLQHRQQHLGWRHSLSGRPLAGAGRWRSDLRRLAGHVVCHARTPADGRADVGLRHASTFCSERGVHLRNIEMATEFMAASPYAGELVVLLGDMNATEQRIDAADPRRLAQCVRSGMGLRSHPKTPSDGQRRGGRR